jgi:hypothetical protein
MPKDTEKYSPEETQKRFVAALRGARIAGPQHEPSKSSKPQQKKRKKKRS